MCGLAILGDTATVRLRWTSSTLLIAVFFGAFAAEAQTIGGRVHASADGSLLPSMVVAAYTTSGVLQANTTTDVNGRYDMALPAGQYRMLAYDPAGKYATEFANDAPSFEESLLIAVAASQAVVLDFALPAGFTVSGTATTSGGPRPGLTVTAYNLSGTRRGFTAVSANGLYSMVLPAGSYKLVAYDDAGAFAPAFYRDRTSFAEAEPVVVGNGTPQANFFLQLGARIFGLVTDSTGAPVENASVYAYTAAGKFVTFVTTGVSGSFTMTLQPGSYRFVAIDNTFRFAAAFYGDATSFEQSPAVTVSAGQIRSGLTFHFDRGGLIAGSVVDATNGNGIAGITVAAYNSDGTERTFVTTDAKGHYVILLPPGTFRLAAFDTNLVWATQFYSMQASFARATGLSATIGQSITLAPFALSHGGRVSGTVTGRTTHAAIAGAIVIAYDAAGIALGQTTTDPDGRYHLVLPEGSYRLVAADPALFYAPGYSGQSANLDQAAEIAVVTDAETTADFALQRGTLVGGGVFDPLQRPVPGIQVTFLDPAGHRVATVSSGADGGFEVSLVPGPYKILLVDPAGRFSATYFGSAALSSATVFVVDATGAPHLTLTMQPFSRRRAVSH